MKYFKFFIFICVLSFTISCGQQKKYIQYKTQEGETMRTIAKRLDMGTKDLLRLNPDVSRKPRANTVIIIPNKESKNGPGILSETKEIVEEGIDTLLMSEKEKQINLLISVLEKEFKIHKVEKGDTFYSLTRLYNVTREELAVLNPELLEGLKLGKFIKIKPIKKVFEEDVFFYKDTIQQGVSIKATFLLPFRAMELDTLSSKEIFKKSKLATIVTDFYLGAEIAIDSLRSQGIELNITVFDTGRNSTEINTIVSENNFEENDVIIGPLYSEEIQFLADKIDTPIIFPVYSKKQTKFIDTTIVKTSPNKQLYRDKLFEYIEENFLDGNIIIVGDNTVQSNHNSIRIKNFLASQEYIDSISVIIPEEGYIKKEKFIEVLKPNMKNSIVLTTDNDLIVANAINSLISLPEETKVTVFTFDKTSVINKVDNLKLAQLGFTFISEEYVKEDAFKAVTFNRMYLFKNGESPSSYAIRGFDVTYDILMRLASGKSLKTTFKEGPSYRVGSKFDYTDKTSKISTNKGLFIVKYNPNLTLTRIK